MRFEFDLRVSAAKSRRRAPAERVCEWEGCDAPGEHRAPKSPTRLREYRWFCLDHVRDYNRAWNFFDGWDDGDVEAYVRNNATWQRPTWKLGERQEAGAPRWLTEDMFDPFGLFGGDVRERAASTEQMRPSLPRALEDALVVLDLDLPLTLSQLKQRYKELVKRCHPDTNGGDRSTEGQLRNVIWAYGLLKGSRYVRK